MAEIVSRRARSSRDDMPVAQPDALSFARRVWITVAIVAACAMGALGVWAGRSALLLIYTSLLLATGLLPLVRRIERVVGGRRWSPPRWSVIAVVYAVFLGLVAMHLSTGIGVSESDSGTGSDATEIQEASFTAPAPADSRPRWLHLSRFRTHQWRGRSSAGWRRIHVHAIARRRCELFPQQTLAERG